MSREVVELITVRSPLRISLGGGGTDLPSYYKMFGGFLVAAAIDKYVYVTINRAFARGILLKYSKYEHVDKIDEIQHPIIKECLLLIDDGEPHIEISSMADIPGGTGLGSSGSFTTALICALYASKRVGISSAELAELACQIEIERLREPIGKQDQYAAVYGGITSYRFNKDDTVDVSPLNLPEETIYELEDNLLLFFTGFTRSASAILKDQKVRSETLDKSMLDNLEFVKDLGYRSMSALKSGKLIEFGTLMHEHWQRKRVRSGSMSNNNIDLWYDLAIKNGAIGGKLVGAGGGGFLMFLTNDKPRLRNAMKSVGLEEVRFKFDFEGTKVLLNT